MCRTLIVVAAAGIAASIAGGHPIYQWSIGFPQSAENGFGIDRAGTDEGTCVVGMTALPPGALEDILVLRRRGDGSPLWARHLVTNRRDVGYTIHETRDLGFIVGAESDIPPGVGTAGIVLIKLDPLGNTQWAFRYGGTPFLDFPAGVSVREGPPNAAGFTTYAAVGRRLPVAGGANAGEFLVVDAFGNPLVQKSYQYLTVFGVFAPLTFTDLRESPPGWVISGWVDESQLGGTLRPFVMQVDGGGNVVWARTYFNVNTPEHLTADGLTMDGPEIVFSGRSSPGSAAASLVVARLDPLGNPIWGRRARFVTDGFQAVELTTNRKIVVAGTINDAFGQDAITTEFDALGIFLYSMRYGGPLPDEGHGICVFDCGHGFNITGLSRVPGAPGSGDVYHIRTTTYGMSGCFEAPYQAPGGIVLAAQQPQLLILNQQEFAPFLHANLMVALPDALHCRQDTCPADIDDGSDTGKPDGGVDINDLLHFLNLFASGDMCADLDDDGMDPPNPDGGVDINDLLFFLFHFSIGC